jgi:hypothetical protein
VRVRRTILGSVAVALVASMALVGAVSAASSYTLFGDAQYVSPGNASSRAVQTNSGPTGAGYGGIDFAFPSGLTLADVNTLSTDFMATVGGCGGGSPRFVVTVQTPTNGAQNVNFYLGATPSYTCPADNLYHNTGNLAAPTNLVDAQQLGGGFYEPYAAVQAAYGSDPVTDIFLVTDAGWAVIGGTQTIVFDNTLVNAMLFTYELPVPTNKDQCKDGGWQNLFRADGSSFKNQGDCIQYVNTGK